jgi:hypothetical protein
MFGFRRLAEAARQFEAAAETSAPCVPGAAASLIIAIEQSLAILREEVASVPVDI